jgi:hypothetical protein
MTEGTDCRVTLRVARNNGGLFDIFSNLFPFPLKEKRRNIYQRLGVSQNL